MTTPTNPALQARTAIDGAVQIPIALLTPSPTNPRKHFDPDRIAQIAASMLAVGQIQPIRARPNPQHTASNGRPAFEIVVGETRWRAATQAGLATLDTIVCDYTDMQVLEVQLVENLQRSDLHPLEEAEGYEQLLRKPDGLQGYATVIDLAARVGKSPSYVYQRVKLLGLCPAGREAFYAGRLTASVALLIARMPDAAEQAKATATIAAGWGGEPYSYRTAADLLQREYMLALGKAPFDILAAYGVAGPCHACPKRSGAAPDLFADVTGGDMCQDSRCYAAKTEEAKQAKLADTSWQDKPVADPAASPNTKDAGTAAAAESAASRPAPAPKGDKAAGPAAARASGGGGGSKGGYQPPDGAERAASAKKAELANLTAQRFAEFALGELHGQIKAAAHLHPVALRIAVLRLFDDLTIEASHAVYALRGWPEFRPNGYGPTRITADFSEKLEHCSSRELEELLEVLLVVEDLSAQADVNQLHDEVIDLADAYLLDLYRINREAATAAAAEIDSKAQPVTDAFIAQHGAGAATPTATTRAKAPIKYRSALTGETWSGRGLQPKWLKVALERGATLADYQV